MKFTSILSVIAALTVVVSTAPVSEPKVAVTNAPPTAAIAPGTGPTTNVADTVTPVVKKPESYVPFYITYPLSDVTLTGGSEATTKWINGIEGPFTINLITGNEPGDMQPTDITFDVQDGRSGTYTWHVPENLPSGKYAYKYLYKKDGQEKDAYSSLFTIANKGASTTAAQTKPADQVDAPALNTKDTTVVNA